MNVTLIRSSAGLVPAVMLLFGSARLFSREKTAATFLQLAGSAGIVLVIFTHVFEALNVFPWMHWGREDSIGHYVDLCGAVLGVGLFPIGYFLHAFARRHL